MTQDRHEQETLLVDLTDVDLHTLSEMPPDALQISLDHLLDERLNPIAFFLGQHDGDPASSAAQPS
ncbi:MULTISPECIES: hypothetical protein [unclassified Solwaraspora]|uniref:hypothetical protein n=1 Tax=unclassified Solwaraspora TaxID=2627926 RepID=UPI00248AE7E3|nr:MULTISPECIES: hypothetical protein [unclassified Solwaraspora]WBB97999.1 hypothetical protein O7553_03305 [Solwaraspora sp. WMMA2059]WBC23442.1 hypothetical protein O7543_14050 [Solwaraspora sp. WMMA2080]WJK34472.1 hypothetical protein O7610_28400 [Solwaraspora sp. WMMA2065]